MALTNWMLRTSMSTSKRFILRKCRHLNILERTKILEIYSQASPNIAQDSLKILQLPISKISKSKKNSQMNTRIGRLGNKLELNLKFP
jgi:hypothetical protein